MSYINITKFLLINSLEKNHSIIKTLRFKNFVFFVQNVFNDIAWNYGNVAVKDFQKNEKLECKKNKLNSDINFHFKTRIEDRIKKDKGSYIFKHLHPNTTCFLTNITLLISK